MINHTYMCSVTDIDIGQCNSVKHRVDLLDNIRFKSRHRRIPPVTIEEVRQHLDQVRYCGIIRLSKPPLSSPEF